MNGINDVIRQDYTGPVCLYKLLAERRKANPSFRRKNPLTFNRNKQKNHRNYKHTFTVELEQKISNRVSFFLIVDTLEKKDHHNYQIIDSKYIIENHSNTFRCIFHMKKLKNLDFTKLYSIHVLIMHSSKENTNDSDFHRASCLCNRLSSFSFNDYLTEEVSLKLKSLMCMIEIKDYLMNNFHFSQIDKSRIPLKSFSSFFSPYHPQCNQRIYTLSARFQCRLYNFPPRESSDVAFSLNISNTSNTVMTVENEEGSKGTTVATISSTKPQPRDRSSERIIKLSQYPKITVHYHFLVKLRQKAKYLEFATQSITNHITCIWCHMKFMKNLYYDKSIKRIANFSTLLLWQYHQHILCCHYHFNSKIFLSDNGHLHYYFSRSDYYTTDKIILKGNKFFETLKSSKLDHSNIITMYWTKDNPISLNKIPTEYYHSSTGLSLSLQDLNYDSDEEEVDLSMTIYHCNNIINEFTDITKHEKELMKLWNTHIISFPPFGDRLFPIVCQRFIIKYCNIIIEKGLRYNLLLHLLNMWDFGLLLAEEIYQYMQYIDRIVLLRNRKGNAYEDRDDNGSIATQC